MRKATAVFLFLLSFTGLATAQCLLSFDAPKPANLPSYLNDVLDVADFDGDGRPDFLVSRAIYLHGTERVELPLTSTEGGVARVTDINHDGRPDLMALSATAFVALINNGNATFTRKVSNVISPNSYWQMLWGDFDGDGALDAFRVGEQPYQTRQLYLGADDGTFKASADLVYALTGRESYQSWLAADIDGDRRAEILVIDEPAAAWPRLSIYRWSGNAFAPRQAGPVVTQNHSVVADFNRDGRDDVLFAWDYYAAFCPLYFDLVSPGSRPGLLFPKDSYYLAADLNGDGAPDLISLTNFIFFGSRAILRTYINDGHGSFQERQALPGFSDRFPKVLDLDGDGVPDLSDGTFLLHGNGDGTFRSVPLTPFIATDAAGLTGDFDGDGDDDVVLPNAIAWNNGDNTFRIATVSDARFKKVATAADADGDGKPELIALDGNVTLVLSLRPDGTLVELANIPAEATAATVGDFSGAHRPELAVLTRVISGIEVKQALAVYEIRNGAAPRFTVPLDGTVQSMAAADLNGDGADELLVSGGRRTTPVNGSQKDGFLSVFLSTRTSFEAERRLTFPDSAVRRMFPGDFDGDGNRDFAFAPFEGFSEINILFGDGKGGFPRRQSFYEGDSIQAADLNFDGRTDLVAGFRWFRVHLGSPAGLVPQQTYFGENGRAYLLHTRQDTLPSILVPLPNLDQALIYRPTCKGPRPRPIRH